MMQTERWHFTHLNFNTQFSLLNVILSSLACQVIVDEFLTCQESIQAFV